MDLGLKGRVAFVGGAGSGLGEGVARGLAAEGVSVALCARNAARLEQVASEIETQYGVQALAVPADLGVLTGVERAVRETLACFGHVDILVSNAGGPPSGKFETLGSEEWDQAYRLLLQSAVTLARGFLPGMRERRWGRIIHSTSVAVKQPINGLMLSNSLRAAVTGFSRTLANEVAADGITVNCVLPGYIRTARLDYLAEKAAETTGKPLAEAFSQWEENIPMGRIGKVREYADLVVFLSSACASYLTGQSIAVDGGVVKSLY